MLTTAKSIQLLDASGMNISPITDITSLYYEVVNSKDTKIISRKYVYDAFPVGVNINPTAEVSIGTHVGISERHPGDNSLYDNGQLYKIADASNKDILVSRVDTDIIPGTTHREIKVTNYNLSEILSYYTPLDLMDASCHALDISINNINSGINDISTRISNLRESLDANNTTLSEIIAWITNNALIPNKFYLINDYYVGDDGCMALPNSEDFSGPDSDNSLSLLVKANDATTLDGKLYEMYDHSGNALKVYGTYKLENSKVCITYMKDQYGNEAPYDFYNSRYNSGSGDNYYWTFTDTNDGEMNALIEGGWSIENNIIKTNPFKSFKLPIFINNSLTKIINNYIGCNNIIKI